MNNIIAAAYLAAQITAGANAQPTKLNLDWERFLAAPTQHRFQTVYGEVKACTDYDVCIHPSKPTTEDADKLATLMSKKNFPAVRLAIASYNLLSTNADAYDDVSSSYGPFIRAFPRQYLRLAHDEGMPDDAVATAAATTPDYMDDDYGKQRRDLILRRAALLKVKDADLMAARDLCLASIDHMIFALTPPSS